MTTNGSGSAPKAGDPAPDFTVKSTAGGKVTLSSFRGKKNVLLAFFPLAFTGRAPSS
jgi:Peroxiredoxin